MRILVTDGMDKSAIATLIAQGHEVVEQFYEPDQLGAALREFDVVVVRSKTKVRANHIDEAKGSKLKLIIRGGVGVDNIDVKYAEANGDKILRFTKALFKAMNYAADDNYEEVAGYVAAQTKTDEASVYDQRGDADWLTGEEVARGAADGTVEKYYEIQQQNFIAAGAVEGEVPVSDYVMLDNMIEAGK